jgi:hypothetical protein
MMLSEREGVGSSQPSCKERRMREREEGRLFLSLLQALVLGRMVVVTEVEK